MQFIFEALTFFGFFFGSLVVGAILLFIGLYIYAIVKDNKEARERTNRYYR